NSRSFDFSGCSTFTRPADRRAIKVAAASSLMYWLRSTPAAWHSAQLEGLSALASGRMRRVKMPAALSSVPRALVNAATTIADQAIAIVSRIQNLLEEPRARRRREWHYQSAEASKSDHHQDKERRGD